MGYVAVVAMTSPGDATSSTLFTWGENKFGQLGQASKSDFISAPKAVDLPCPVRQVSCSKGDKHCHTSCVDQQGQVYSWGDPYKGQLGFALKSEDGGWNHAVKGLVSTPKLLSKTALDGKNVIKVVCAGIHTLAITAEGELYSWGCGSDGRLGHPEYEGHNYLYKESFPKLVETLAKQGRRVIDAACSYYHNVAIVS